MFDNEEGDVGGQNYRIDQEGDLLGCIELSALVYGHALWMLSGVLEACMHRPSIPQGEQCCGSI